MAQEVLRSSLTLCRCAQCKLPLVNPVQLGACMHILCKKCITALESEYFNNVNCPKCGVENAKPSILNRISGIELVASAGDAEGGAAGPCDYDASHESAMWNCFICAKNICRGCRSSHPLDHGEAMSLLAPARPIRIFKDISAAASVAGGDHTDAPVLPSPGFLEYVGDYCPLCEATSCPHMDVLELLHTQPDQGHASCEIGSHKDCDGQPLLKSYFCCQCWIPVCGDCSQKGDHKLHKTTDLQAMRGYVHSLASDLRRKLRMLLAKAKCDQQNEKQVEENLLEHVSHVSRLINQRKCKILEEVTRIFNRAVDDADRQGKDIVRVYSKKVEETKGLCKFLEALSSALNVQVDESMTTVQCVNLFSCLLKAEPVIEQLAGEITRDRRPREHRLVLHGLDSPSMSGPSVNLCVAGVSRECKVPPLAFSFKLNNEISLVNSIVIKGSDQCFLSCRMTLERKNDAIIHYWGDHSHPVETVTDVQRGRYYITRLTSGEIVASYSSAYGNAVKYFENDEFFMSDSCGEFAQFEDITKPLDFAPRGIAATKQNTIVLCMAVPENDKGKSERKEAGSRDLSYLMLMSLHGKVLEEAEHTACSKLSPNCVAVSDSGEICVCDPKNSTIAILDSKLKVKETLTFSWPTSLSHRIQQFVCGGMAMTDESITFSPEGVCYDRYGRIIVADPNNNIVVRLTRSVGERSYHMEPLVSREDSPELQDFFRSPRLVALGDDGRLWVVCREHVFVFQYGI